MNYTKYQLQTPVIILEGLYKTSPEKDYFYMWEQCGFAHSLYQIWEDYRPKQTLKSLLLK